MVLPTDKGKCEVLSGSGRTIGSCIRADAHSQIVVIQVVEDNCLLAVLAPRAHAILRDPPASQLWTR